MANGSPSWLLALVGLLLGGCVEWGPPDLDGDGVTIAAGDCDDLDPAIGPGAPEIWYNGVDENCDGNDGDQDGDGYVPDAYAEAFPDWDDPERWPAHLGAGDCWDDPTTLPEAFTVVAGQGWDQLGAVDVHPGARERWYDGVDQDCAGDDDFDQDGDGYRTDAHPDADGSVGDDCQDVPGDVPANPEGLDAADVHPGVSDTCYDGFDADCDDQQPADGHPDPASYDSDFDCDGDGWMRDEECDDANPDARPDPLVEEVWYNGVDENCDGNDGDQDGDGYVVAGYAFDWTAFPAHLGEGDCWDDPNPPVPDDFVPVNGFGSLAADEVHPGATERWYDGVDQDCAGDYDFDQDGDGFGIDDDTLGDPSPEAGDPPALDCDDVDPAVSPSASEVCDGLSVDEDCDGNSNDPGAVGCTDWYLDADGDGVGVSTSVCLCMAEGDYRATVDGDCDDTRDWIHPGAPELCDAADLDEDCDGASDDLDAGGADGKQTWYVDADGDGYGDAGDPGAAWCDPPAGLVLDNTDCDDAHADANPGGTEVCDADDIDQDCDGLPDDLDPEGAGGKQTWYVDADGDGYGDVADLGTAWCDPPAGVVLDHTDCDDAHADAHPGGTEVCDADDIDQDCDGGADDADPQGTPSTILYYVDADGDGYGDAGDPGTAWCDPPAGVVTDNTDCDDAHASAHPGATETCDADDVDEDCDGFADDADPEGALGRSLWYVDADGDGQGDQSDPGTLYCDPPAGVVSTNTDCDDAHDTAYVGGLEVCDPEDVDEDCDGLADDADPAPAGRLLYYVDADGDGFGDQSDPGTFYCDPPAGVVLDNTDCDDAHATAFPGGTEVCDPDNVDEDCDGWSDNNDDAVGKQRYYVDVDGDGYGDASDAGILYCDPPAGVVLDNTDCDDLQPTAYPGATEACDALDVDEDCDGFADDADPEGATGKVAYYPDADGDGQGDASAAPVTVCDPDPGYVADNRDCDDAHANAYVGGTEICDAENVDEDCDGGADDADPDGSPATTLYHVDADGDGYGDASDPGTPWCDPPPNVVADDTDCDDAHFSAHPGGTETCDPDDVDEDCDGGADDADPEGANGQISWYVDADGDGYGAAGSTPVVSCDVVAGHAANADDCDDAHASANPAGIEVCDPDDVDEDCDGGADDADPDGASGRSFWYVDADGDGQGDENDAGALYCDPPLGLADNNLDCDDAHATAFAGGTEVCDAADVDEDCDGFADDADPEGAAGTVDHWPDADGDGYGDRTVAPTPRCDPDGTVPNGDDCDDGDPSIPDAEVDDEVDNDCDDMVDEGFRSTGDLVITEIMYDPRGGDTFEVHNQWIEVYNPTPFDIYADGIVFTSDGVCADSGAVGGAFVVAPGGLVVPAGGLAVLCHGGSQAGAILGYCDYVYGLDVDDTVMDNGTSLVGATADPDWCLSIPGASVTTIELSLDGFLIDSVSYEVGSNGWPAAPNGASIVLDPGWWDFINNDVASHWCYPDAADLYDTGSSPGTSDDQYGSPGSVGGCSATAP